MPFISCPNAAVAVIHATQLGKPIANVLNFQFTAPYTQSNLDALALVCDANVGGSYLPLIAPSVTYDRVDVRGLTFAVDLSSTNNTNTGPGTGAGAEIPSNSSNCITLLTGLTGRSARGRFYAMPATQSFAVDAHTWGSGYGPALVAFLNDIRAGAYAIGWTLSVLSKQNNNVALNPHVTRPVTSVVARNELIDSQRNRLSSNH